MLIAQRNLTGTKNGFHTSIPVNFYLPEALGNGDYRCRFEIGWPDGATSSAAHGVDAVAALLTAMKMAGSLIYTSAAHENGELVWLEPHEGYGLPLPSSIRDLYQGDDRDL